MEERLADKDLAEEERERERERVGRRKSFQLRTDSIIPEVAEEMGSGELLVGVACGRGQHV